MDYAFNLQHNTRARRLDEVVCMLHWPNQARRVEFLIRVKNAEEDEWTEQEARHAEQQDAAAIETLTTDLKQLAVTAPASVHSTGCFGFLK